MAEERGRATNGRRTKTLSWYASDQAVLRALRAAVTAKSGLLLTERDVVAAALRLALRDPSGPWTDPARGMMSRTRHLDLDRAVTSITRGRRQHDRRRAEVEEQLAAGDRERVSQLRNQLDEEGVAE